MGEICSPEEVSAFYSIFQAVIERCVRDFERGDITRQDVKRFCDSQLVELYGLDSDYLFKLIIDRASH